MDFFPLPEKQKFGPVESSQVPSGEDGVAAAPDGSDEGDVADAGFGGGLDAGLCVRITLTLAVAGFE